ncbi:SDR family NAD(P)-dependent oxidoreductase [Sphingomonas solaris]|uniref:SDR family oxidoreductase n=1 Tax=Alterirhizorhabdus solaris TaxID=2529389 RepID=A0A558R9B2_9SPHN|nr:SDR family NAD(P)-dependent oxidoreductase [Sphingomonas solaris]TVV75967.1 SDR family oxidoreductase [Sphingomonas solaris]
MTLTGRRIVVTGAASGIGLATARLLVEAGARVAMLDVSEERVKALAAAVGADAIICDVSDARQIEAAAVLAEQVLDGVDGIVNAAGILAMSPFEAISADMWHRTLAVNLTGPMLLSQALLPALRRAASATIVNVASIGGIRPGRGAGAYAASKAGLVALSKAMAVELGPRIRVNVVCPGTIETPMSDGLLLDTTIRERLVSSNMLQRLGQASEIADAIVFLTGGASSYVNGSTLVVDGGYTFS